MKQYTYIDISENEDGSEVAINCNDWGAFVIRSGCCYLLETDVEHHASCKPTDPKLFELEEGLEL